VIHFGFNESFLEPCDPEEIDRIKKKYAITGDYILSVGDLHPRKNLIRLVEALNWHIHGTTPICGTFLYDRAKAEGRLNLDVDYRTYEPTGNLFRLHLPMKLDHLSIDDIAIYRNRINRHMKFQLLLNCLVYPRLWKEIFLSRGLRTIAFNFIRRHFKLFNRTASRQAQMLHSDQSD
jgi:hypothetical protein